MTFVMTINSGSSSLKFKLYDMPEEKVLCSGNCERVGEKVVFSLLSMMEKKKFPTQSSLITQSRPN